MSPNNLADPKIVTKDQVGAATVFSCDDLRVSICHTPKCCEPCHTNNDMQCVKYHGKIYLLCCNVAEHVIHHC